MTATGTQTTQAAGHARSAATLNQAVRDSLARAARAHRLSEELVAEHAELDAQLRALLVQLRASRRRLGEYRQRA